MKRIILILFLLALALGACDDKPVNPGTYPCSSAIAPCHTPTP